ncbi:biotin transporter BioY [Phycobacter sp. K97]|uniref:biotin transporter BioY n=1 Tax=Phycobacter sedimenti TaxID=3133977 RepID=UPI00311DC656
MERSIAYISLFAALIAALGFIPQITLAFGVPVTAQSMGIMLCGTVLGARRGLLAVLLFLLLVALGLPLLSGGRGGLAVFGSPTAGFLFGFPVAAFVTGLIMERLRSVAILPTAIVASVIGGILVLYLFGVTGMAITLKKSFLEAASLILIFIPGDILKAVIAGLLTAGLARARPSSLLSRSV